jgi:hypothetical protein
MKTPPATIHLSESFRNVQQQQQEMHSTNIPGSQPGYASKLQAHGLYSSSKPTKGTSSVGRNRVGRVGLFIESVLLTLGDLFIDRLVDELQYWRPLSSQSAQMPTRATMTRHHCLRKANLGAHQLRPQLQVCKFPQLAINVALVQQKST